MAKSCSIGLYKVSVRMSRDPDSELDLTKNLLEGKPNFYDYFTSVLQKYENEHFRNEDTEDYLKLERIDRTKHESYIKIQGLIESGDSGYMARLFHTQERTSRSRSKEEAEMLPYFFCLAQTNDSKYAALCVQRFGKTGMLTNLKKCLKENFRKDFPSLVLQIDPFLPDFYIKKFIVPKQVQEFRYTVLAPVADSVTLLMNEGARDSQDMDVVIETRIKAKRRGRMSLSESETTDVGDLLARIVPRNVDHSKIVDKSITFISEDGQSRTFRASRPDNNAMPYIEIEARIDDNNGHPSYEDVKGSVDTILVESKLY